MLPPKPLIVILPNRKTLYFASRQECARELDIPIQQVTRFLNLNRAIRCGVRKGWTFRDASE